MELQIFYKEMLKEQYGENELIDIEKGLEAKRPVTLRVNTLKANKEEVQLALDRANILYENVSWYNDAFVIKNASEEDIQKLEIYENGKIYLQSLSSMLPPIILDPKQGENILDMAAAPGGKTTQIAALTQNKAFITACERNRIRGEKLKYNLQKQGAGAVNIMLEDARNLSDYFSFDKILLDAPCSGSGTDNVFKKNFTLELLEKSSKIQTTLLKKALKILKPGSEMVYSTCSILKKENEEVLEMVLRESNASIVPIVAQKEIPTLPVTINGVLCVKPSDLFEGFFVAKIRKNK